MRQAKSAGLSRNDVGSPFDRASEPLTRRYLVGAQLYDEIPRRAVLRAALLRHGKNAVLWGATAAEMHGIAGMVGWPGQPWVLLPFDEAKPPDLNARLRFRVPCPAEVVIVDGFPVIAPDRTLADLVPLVDRPTGLGLFDSALHVEAIDRDGLTRVCELARVVGARLASGTGDPRRRSGSESTGVAGPAGVYRRRRTPRRASVAGPGRAWQHRRHRRHGLGP